MTDPVTSIVVFLVVLVAGRFALRIRFNHRRPDDIEDVATRRREAAERLHQELARHRG